MVRTAPQAFSIASATSAASSPGLIASSAAIPCGIERDPMTCRCFSVSFRAWRAARMMFLSFGKTATSSVGQASTASTISRVLGFIVGPPEIVRVQPRL